MNERVVRTVLRGVALLIAVLGVIDPSVTSNRAAKPEISVLAVNSEADSALARRVTQQLGRAFTVMNAPYAASAATVFVGSHVPAVDTGLTGVVFAVAPDSARASTAVDVLDVPAVAAVDARVPVNVVARVRQSDGKSVEFTLLSNGALVDRVSRTVSGNDARVNVPLSFVPTAVGVASLRVTAGVKGGESSASADAIISVQKEKWAVLFFDARPSWMSTFVRRAVERDPRFAATSRIVTSTNLSTDAGKPPATLDDPNVPELYDAIIVGAPEALSERDVAGLEHFLRRRGGNVVLLFDGNKSGRYERLGAFTPFTNTANALPAIITDVRGDSVAMRATEWMWPVRLPEGATVLAWSDAKDGAVSSRRPIVWATRAGAGRVIVSGALDAWKFRDTKQSGFERFWQQTVAAAASSAAPSVEIDLPRRPLMPGEKVSVEVTARAAALAELRVGAVAGSGGGVGVRAELALAMVTDSGRSTIRAWPTGVPGVFRGSFRAPGEPGTYSIVAAANGASGATSLVVARDVRVANAAEPGLLAAFAAARGGSVVSEGRLEALTSLLEAAVKPQARRVLWHPMRSVWWLLPFAAALSLEWYLRRRSGLP